MVLFWNKRKNPEDFYLIYKLFFKLYLYISFIKLSFIEIVIPFIAIIYYASGIRKISNPKYSIKRVKKRDKIFIKITLIFAYLTIHNLSFDFLSIISSRLLTFWSFTDDEMNRYVSTFVIFFEIMLHYACIFLILFIHWYSSSTTKILFILIKIKLRCILFLLIIFILIKSFCIINFIFGIWYLAFFLLFWSFGLKMYFNKYLLKRLLKNWKYIA